MPPKTDHQPSSAAVADGDASTAGATSSGGARKDDLNEKDPVRSDSSSAKKRDERAKPSAGVEGSTASSGADRPKKQRRTQKRGRASERGDKSTAGAEAEPTSAAQTNESGDTGKSGGEASRDEQSSRSENRGRRGRSKSSKRSRPAAEKRGPPCHADHWLASAVPVCYFGGEREPDEDERASKEVAVRPLPYRACLHRIKPEDGEKKAFVDEYDTEKKRWMMGRQTKVLPEYAVYIQGPFTGYDKGKEQGMIWDVDSTGRENLKRISNFQGRIEVWDLTDTDGQDADDSKFGRELCLSFHVIQESSARDFMSALEHHLLGIYLRDEAVRLDKLTRLKDVKQGARAAKNEAHTRAAEHIFQFFNYGRGDFEIDLHHLRLAGHEAEQRLIEKVQEIGRVSVEPSLREKYLEVIVGRGSHSGGGKQVLFPAVEKMLRRWSDDGSHGMAGTCVETANVGSFLVVFAEYEGASPCYGWFFCSECENVWPSLRVHRVDWNPETEERPDIPAYKQQCQSRRGGGGGGGGGRSSADADAGADRRFQRKQRCGNWVEPVKLSHGVPASFCRQRVRYRNFPRRHNEETCGACKAGVCRPFSNWQGRRKEQQGERQ